VRRPIADLSERPVIIASNHSAGFADPILIVHAVERWPSFLAKATFWTRPIVGKFFDLFGVLPVYRASDGGTEGNLGTFDACHTVLNERGVIALFPEGQINDAPKISDIRTGTARIALGARATGTTGIVVVPVGIHYEEQTRRRSRIYAKVGEPIDLDADIGRYVSRGGPEDDTNHEAVRLLTTDIEDRLREVAPDYDSDAEWETFGTAAEIWLRARQYDPSVEVSYGDREELAHRLAHAAPEIRDAVLEATAAYEEILAHENVSDIAVASLSLAGGVLPDHTVRSMAETVALAPAAAVGLVVNALPLAAMKFLRKNLKVKPLIKSTIRTIAAPIVYGGAWSVVGVLLRRRGVRFGGTVAWLSGMVGGWALVLASERIEDVRRGRTSRTRFRDTDRTNEVRAARQTVLDAVDGDIG
jgi:1-acyl-sn-glycerol-3-phosphate acyltransferase